MKKICIITGARAEYGLLYWVIKGIQEDPEMELQLVATGMHLSPEFGLTYRQIEKDGFSICKKVETILSSDSSIGISKSIGLALISFAEAYEELKPDLIIVLGDRTEIFAAACAALIAGIPISHIHGGELTEGAYDDALRHSITKMSHLHFTSTETYRKRVIQLGEGPDTVFNVGALGLDNIKKLSLLSKNDVESAIKFNLLKQNILVTFHPVTLENATAKEQFQSLLDVLSELNDVGVIFTKPNSDKDGRCLIQMIDDFVEKHKSYSVAYSSLGQMNYLSTMKHMDAVVGNSSSGIIETPCMNIPTVNIGDRQKGRIMGETVVCCNPSYADIKRSIYQALQFDKTKEYDNPYGEGCASDQIVKIIKSVKNISIKKTFNDIRF